MAWAWGGGACQALPRELLAPELSCLCLCPWWVGQRCHLLARGYQLHLLCPWVAPGPVMLGGCSSGCWLGLGRVGSSPQHPCSVWFVFFLGPCLSAHLPLPDLRRCPSWTCPPLKDWPWAHLVLMWCMDLWSLSLCRIKIAQACLALCLQLLGDWEGLAVGKGPPQTIFGGPATQTCVLWTRALRRPTPVCSAPRQYYRSHPPLPRAQCGSRVDVFVTKNIY